MKRPHVQHRACPTCDGTGKLLQVNGQWARLQRLKAALSLREVARRVDLSAAYVSDLELGRRPMGEGLWKRIEAALRESS